MSVPIVSGRRWRIVTGIELGPEVCGETSVGVGVA